MGTRRISPKRKIKRYLKILLKYTVIPVVAFWICVIAVVYVFLADEGLDD